MISILPRESVLIVEYFDMKNVERDCILNVNREVNTIELHPIGAGLSLAVGERIGQDEVRRGTRQKAARQPIKAKQGSAPAE